jgi:hypothetical protein
VDEAPIAGGRRDPSISSASSISALYRFHPLIDRGDRAHRRDLWIEEARQPLAIAVAIGGRERVLPASAA